MILEIMPKLIVTHVVDLIQEFRHVSILAIRRLMNFIRLFRLLIDMHPEVGEEMDAKLNLFKSDPSSRTKDKMGSLGDLLTFATVSQKHRIGELLTDYLEE